MPPGVLSLVAGRVAGSCDPAGTLAALGKYLCSVLLGLGIHGGAVLPAMYALATRNWSGRMMLGRGNGDAGGYARCFEKGAPALVTAFATDYLVPRRCRWRRSCSLGVPSALADFALPLGATANMNGTALYESLTVLFIAQLHGVELGVWGTTVVAATATIAAVGAAAVLAGPGW